MSNAVLKDDPEKYFFESNAVSSSCISRSLEHIFQRYELTLELYHAVDSEGRFVVRSQEMKNLREEIAKVFDLPNWLTIQMNVHKSVPAYTEDGERHWVSADYNSVTGSATRFHIELKTSEGEEVADILYRNDLRTVVVRLLS